MLRRAAAPAQTRGCSCSDARRLLLARQLCQLHLDPADVGDRLAVLLAAEHGRVPAMPGGRVLLEELFASGGVVGHRTLHLVSRSVTRWTFAGPGGAVTARWSRGPSHAGPARRRG